MEGVAGIFDVVGSSYFKCMIIFIVIISIFIIGIVGSVKIEIFNYVFCTQVNFPGGAILIAIFILKIDYIDAIIKHLN